MKRDTENKNDSFPLTFFRLVCDDNEKKGGRGFFSSLFFFALSPSLKKAPMSSSREILGRFDFSCEIEVLEIGKRKGSKEGEGEPLSFLFPLCSRAHLFFLN